MKYSHRFVRTLAVLWSVSAGANVELDVSPATLAVDESFRLTYRITHDFDGDPDFSALGEIVDIVSQNHQTSIKWINGARTRSTSWAVTAMARTSGKLTLPAIEFGRWSSPQRTIEIAAASAPAPDGSADIVLEVGVDTDNPYVQQQVLYTVRLYHRIHLNSPRFSSLTTSADAIVKALGTRRNFVHKLGGRRFEAFEERYAVFPQQSGPVTIHPLVFTTQVETGKRSSFDRLSQLLTTRRIESTAIELAVRPVPAQFPRDATWLPARRLRLHDDWEPAHDLTHVGAPLSRTVHLWADGLVAAQLPEVGVAAPSGVKVYPDQPQTSERETPAGFTAVRQEKYALIASTPGGIQFPTLELPWWNTESDQLEYARIRARAFTVRAPAHANASPPPLAAETATAKRDDAATAPPTRKRVWFWATQALLGAWLVTCLLWWRDRRRRWPPAAGSTTVTDSEPTSSGAMRELRSACRMNDARPARDALLHWSAAQAPGHGPAARSLRGLCTSADPILAAQILVLEAHLYGADGERWMGQKLWLAFDEFRSRPPPVAAMAVPATPLPHLFKLANK